MPELFDEATKVTAKHGDVVLDGPDGVDVALTPDAALTTSDRLLDAAAEARGQQVSAEWETTHRQKRHTSKSPK
jgi:membrane peptidoglycan carboxypeptidase